MGHRSLLLVQAAVHRVHTADQGMAQSRLLLPSQPVHHAQFDLAHLLIARL
jgi:hypothetical protein